MSFIQNISDGRTDLIVDHILKGGDVNASDINDISLVKIAAYYGDVSAIKLLLEHGAKLTDLGDNYDLNGAAFHGHWQLCQFLLESGADPNHPLKSTGETPLHSALSKSNDARTLQVIRTLLAYGANPEISTIAGKETGAFMRDARTLGEYPLHRAAAFSDEEVITELLKAGARKDAKDMNGASPLSWASWHLRPGRILKLLSFPPHNIHPLHEKNIRGDHGYGYGASIMSGLIGKVNIP